VFELSKTSGYYQYEGSAHYYTGSDFHEVRGRASANLDGPRLNILVAWQENGATTEARYKGGN
jgi:hypothetical protein